MTAEPLKIALDDKYQANLHSDLESRRKGTSELNIQIEITVAICLHCYPQSLTTSSNLVFSYECMQEASKYSRSIRVIALCKSSFLPGASNTSGT